MGLVRQLTTASQRDEIVLVTIDNILVLAILAAALALFISEKLRVDIVAMLVLATLVITGLVVPEEAFAGFSSPAVITVGAVFFISGAR
jgi:di/tricarboxylate transporter